MTLRRCVIKEHLRIYKKRNDTTHQRIGDARVAHILLAHCTAEKEK